MDGLDRALAQEGAERVVALTALVADSEATGEDVGRLKAAMVAAVEEGTGTGRDRFALGCALARLGDPRIERPQSEAYWVAMSPPYQDGWIARHLVTNDEYQAWVSGGGYQDRPAWSDEGWAWLDATPDPWYERR